MAHQLGHKCKWAKSPDLCEWASPRCLFLDLSRICWGPLVDLIYTLRFPRAGSPICPHRRTPWQPLTVQDSPPSPPLFILLRFSTLFSMVHPLRFSAAGFRSKQSAGPSGTSSLSWLRSERRIAISFFVYSRRRKHRTWQHTLQGVKNPS